MTPATDHQFEFAASPPLYRRMTIPATKFIVGSTIAIYFLQLLNYFFPAVMRFDVTELLSCSRPGLEAGYYWQLITYAWIHSINLPIHIVVNLLMVYVLGGEVERMLGSMRLLALYVGGAIAGAATFLFFNWVENENVAGASASAFCLLTSLAVLEPRRRLDVLLFFVIPLRLTAVTLAFVVCAVEIAFIVFGWLPFISHSAHLGGAAFGVILSWYFKPKHLSINNPRLL
jgi:membrane associated rhomboid family serine protease